MDAVEFLKTQVRMCKCYCDNHCDGCAKCWEIWLSQGVKNET